MNKLIHCLRDALRGRSIIRSFMDYRLREEYLRGRILDLGSGGSDAYRFKVPISTDAEYMTIDRKTDEQIDFETDRLPYDSGAFNSILLLNVLEHIYNYQHLLKEAKRVKCAEGRLIGFVPFLMWYHPAHRDYFRYTDEALERMLSDEGYQDIRVESLCSGPYLSAYQMIYSTIPQVVRPFLLLSGWLLDFVFRTIRPAAARRYPLGYFFTAR